MEWLPQVGVEGVYSSSSRTGDEFCDYASERGPALFHAVAFLLTPISR